MAHSRNLRKGRYSVDNGIYLATFATEKRREIFKELETARIVVRYINQSPYADTLAFVVMPDHVHWLLQLRTSKSISQVVRAVKSLVTRAIRAQTSENGTIWQTGFHDHAIRHEEAIRNMARYIVANPLRAGLVKKIGDYPHWDAVWLTDSRSGDRSHNQ